MLHIDWRGEALHRVVNHLEGIVDFKQYSSEAYKDTHLYRFLRMVNLLMGWQLWELMENSVKHLIEFFRTTIHDKGPVFVISMCLKDNQMQFKPSLEELSARVMATVDNIFVDAATIMKMDSEVFPIIELPPESLSNVSPQEAHLLAQRKGLEEMIDEALAGPPLLDPDRLEKDVADWVISMTKMKKQFKGLEAPIKVRAHRSRA